MARQALMKYTLINESSGKTFLVIFDKEDEIVSRLREFARKQHLPAKSVKDGGRGIRTPGALPSTTVFKTAGFSHSPIPPVLRIYLLRWEFQILDREVLLAIRLSGDELHGS